MGYEAREPYVTSSNEVPAEAAVKEGSPLSEVDITYIVIGCMAVIAVVLLVATCWLEREVKKATRWRRKHIRHNIWSEKHKRLQTMFQMCITLQPRRPSSADDEEEAAKSNNLQTIAKESQQATS